MSALCPKNSYGHNFVPINLEKQVKRRTMVWRSINPMLLYIFDHNVLFVYKRAHYVCCLNTLCQQLIKDGYIYRNKLFTCLTISIWSCTEITFGWPLWMTLTSRAQNKSLEKFYISQNWMNVFQRFLSYCTSIKIPNTKCWNRLALRLTCKYVLDCHYAINDPENNFLNKWGRKTILVS